MTQQVPQVPPTETALTGVRNFRDVGGLPTTDGRRTAFGRLYRSGHLAHATTEDAIFLGGLGLHTIFDFATPPTTGSTDTTSNWPVSAMSAFRSRTRPTARSSGDW